MKTIITIIISVFILNFVFANDDDIVSPEDYGTPVYSISTEGKSLFIKNKCFACHHLESEGLQKLKGRSFDLSKLQIQDSIILKSYLLKIPGFKVVVKDKTFSNHPVSFKGSEDELSEIIKWLYQVQYIKEETK